MIFASDLNPSLSKYAAERVAEFEQIPAERRVRLGELAGFVRARSDAGRPVRLTFICTHNSRRSQMAQLWAVAAAAHFGVEGVEAFSGGTECTAFNARALAALRRAGFSFDERKPVGANPHFDVRYAEDGPAVECYSKVYFEPPNPQEEFCAIMTCSDADEACPQVVGAALRLAIAYQDPKSADDTSAEASVYDERCRQIAREMLYAFSLASERR